MSETELYFAKLQDLCAKIHINVVDCKSKVDLNQLVAIRAS